MTEHITTEEAERIADDVDQAASRLWKWDQWGNEAASAEGAAYALRSLAAERDALREDLRWIESVAGEPSEPHYGQALSAVRDRAHFALGENQP